MPPLPTVTSKQVVKALLALGFKQMNQTGSHAKFRRRSNTVIVPIHRGDLKRGTLSSILKQAGITVDELTENI